MPPKPRNPRGRPATAEERAERAAANSGARNWLITIKVIPRLVEVVRRLTVDGDGAALWQLFEGSRAGSPHAVNGDAALVRFTGQEEFYPERPADSHLHLYVRFPGTPRANQAARHFTWRGEDICHAHAVKHTFGSDEKVIAYCTKIDGRFPGTRILSLGEAVARPGRRTDHETIVQELCESKSLTEIAKQHPGWYVRNHNGAAALLRAITTPRASAKRLVIWIFGVSGAGKSCLSRRLAEHYFVAGGGTGWDAAVGLSRAKLLPTGFVIGVDERTTAAVFDDIDVNAWRQWWTTIMELLDTEPCSVNIKGGSCRWNADPVFITCKRPPHLALRLLGWSEDVAKYEIMRRLTYVVRCTGEWELPTWYSPEKIHADDDDVDPGDAHLATGVPAVVAGLTPRVRPPAQQEVESDSDSDAPVYEDDSEFEREQLI